jgi:hypothetical protein
MGRRQQERKAAKISEKETVTEERGIEDLSPFTRRKWHRARRKLIRTFWIGGREGTIRWMF